MSWPRLAETLPRLGAWRMEVAERDDGQAIFLQRVVRGASDHSYGVQVARMAGLPAEVTARAATLLRERLDASMSVAESPVSYRDDAGAQPDAT